MRSERRREGYAPEGARQSPEAHPRLFARVAHSGAVGQEDLGHRRLVGAQGFGELPPC